MRKHTCFRSNAHGGAHGGHGDHHECYDDGGHYYRHNDCLPAPCGEGGADWWIWIAIIAVVLLFIL